MSDVVIQVFDCEQGTPEWRECRRGIPTASAFHSVLAQGEGKTRRKYMLELIGEQITGLPADSFTNAHTERGHEMEIEARNLLSFDYSPAPRTVGFVRRDVPGVGLVGCSPDALIGADGMLEIKSKLPHLQIEVLLKDRVPPEHVAQCQGALWVAQREWLDFVSYWPGLPLFIKRVTPDLEYHAKLEAGLAAFMKEMAEARAAISTLTSTPPRKRPDPIDDFKDLTEV